MISRLILDQAYDDEHDRRVRIMDAWKAYEGNMPKPLKVKSGDPDDNLRVDLSQGVVGKGVSFLFPPGVAFEVDGQAESDADTWLAQCWEANSFLTTLLKIGINGGVTGDVFLRIYPRAPFPRVMVLDPANVTVITDEDDCEEVLAYLVQWNVRGKEKVKRQIIERDDAAAKTWTITDFVSEEASSWVQVGEPVTWGYEWAPIFHCQNLPAPNCYYGYSDLEAPVLELNHGLNTTLSNINRILRYHAHPKTVLSGVASPPKAPGAILAAAVNPNTGQNGMDVAPDGLIKLADPNAKMYNLEMGSDLGSSLAFYREVKDLHHEVSRVPEIANGKVDGLGQIAGVALQILYQPLIEKTRDKRTLYGEMLEKLGAALLQMWRKGSTHQVKTKWPPILPSDPKGEAETGALLEGLGVSKDTVLTGLGFDAAEEAKKKAKEQKSDAELGRQRMREFDAGREQPLAPEDEELDPEA